MQIYYTQGHSATDNHPRMRSIPDFDTFESIVTQHCTAIGITSSDTKAELDAKKRQLPYLWHAYAETKPKRRRAESAGALCFLPLDLDGTTLEGWEAVRAAIPWRGFAYTTASHLHPTAGHAARFRLVFEPSRPVLPHEKAPLLKALQLQITDAVALVCDDPIQWDEKVYTAAQVLFMPDEHAQFWSFSGQAVNVDSVLARCLPYEKTTVKVSPDDDDLSRWVDLDNVNEHTFSDLRSALWHPEILSLAKAKCGNHHEWAAMGNRLAWFRETDYEAQARQLWLEWSATGCDDDCAEAKRRWDEGKLAADRTGYQAIFSTAQKAGWHNPYAERLQNTVARIENFDIVPTSTDDQGFPDIYTDMLAHFLDRFIYVIKDDQVCDLSRPPYRGLMDMKSFKHLMAPYQIPATGKGKPTPATAKWLEHPQKQVAESTGYLPGGGRLIRGDDGRFEINEFYMPEHGQSLDTSKVEIFLNHMAYLVPDDWQRQFFIARLAWFVQRPERRCPISILHVATAHGTGRGWVSQLMEKVLGPWNCSRTRMKILCDDPFHDYLYHTLLCTVDEVRENDKRYEVNDKIRDVLTEPRFEVNRKYGSKQTIDIFTGFLLYTNHYDALALPEEDRRIAVLGGPDVEAGEEHYVHLYAALNDSDFISQVYWFLMRVDLSVFNWQRAPDTKERQIMIESNKSEVETALISVLEDPPVAAMTYRQIVNEIIKDVGLDVKINQKHITRILKERTKRSATELIKVKGIGHRFWILEKNSDFSKDELRKMFEKCEKMQNEI